MSTPPVVLRIKLRFDDAETMVQRFAGNVGKQGLFLPTKSLQPIGAEVKFELRIVTDAVMLVGLGRVKATRAPDPDDPRATFGMALELLRVSREGRELILKMLERRRALGLPDVAIPMAEDVDAAKRIEGGGVVERMPMFQSEPVSAAAFPAVRLETGPVVAARERSGGVAAVAPLAPEASRPRRPKLAELIERANELSGAALAAAPPELDEHVDVERAIVRARALAGGDLDGELAALREEAAAPVAIDVEAASIELARQLGGESVSKRERLAWAPPPPTTSSSAADRSPPEPAGLAPIVDEAAAREQEAADAKARAEADQHTHEEAAERHAREETEAAERRAREEAEAKAREEAEAEQRAREHALATARMRRELVQPNDDYEPPRAPVLIDDHADVAQIAAALDGDHEIAPADLDPAEPIVPLDVHRIRSGELELADDDENTHIGTSPELYAIPGYETQPSVPDDLAGQLDAQLAEAEAEADATFVPQPSNDDDFEGEEISDLDVIAIADEEDADLLAADGEREASGRVVQHAAPTHDPDFASRLALDDDSIDPTYDPPSGPYTVDHGARAAEPTHLREAPDEDLESALSNLDGDFDDLEVRTGQRAAVPRAQRASQRPTQPPRASTDDGVLIDFDDDE